MNPSHRVIIMGAAGRDFHNFNVVFRNDPGTQVVAFTATQIPNIAGRRYPPELAGPLYPEGIPILPEMELDALIKAHAVDRVVFAYSDISHVELMHRAARVAAAGADFLLLGPRATMLEAKVPVVSVCAVRTGCGKSPVSRRVVSLLREQGLRVVVVRHPMPYGHLSRQRVQRFATLVDLDAQDCTIEEREEYEPHIQNGVVVYAGADYEAILRQAEQEADVLLWDGGNNDMPFYRSDLEITVVDPHRPGHERLYWPGEVNFRRGQVIVVNKVDTAQSAAVAEVLANICEVNPAATVIETASPIHVDSPELIRGKRVLVVEDGPTLTHGEMGYGAGVVAAKQFGAAELVDPRPFAVGELHEAFARFPHIGWLLPALGYSHAEIAELETTINRADCDLVLVATPIDLSRLMTLNKPVVRVTYEIEEVGRPNLADVLVTFAERVRVRVG